MMQRILSVLFIVFVCSTLVVGQTSLNIPDGDGILGENIQVPILLDLDIEDEILGITLKVSFDTTALEYVGTSRIGTISDSLTTATNLQGDQLLISMAGINSLSESGDLILLEFKTLVVGTSNIGISEYRINEDELVFPENEATIKVFDEGGNQPPLAVQIPDTLTFFSGDSLSLLVDENLFFDPEDDFENLIITFSLTPESVIADFDPVNSLLTLSSAEYAGFATLSVRVEDLDGGVLEFDIILDIQIRTSNEEISSAPSNFILNQNYPNPFNPATNISYSLPTSGDVLLEVYALNGQKVATLVDGFQNFGTHTIRFDASGLSSGIYVYRFVSQGANYTRKMLLIK